jgi:hypothetical protein
LERNTLMTVTSLDATPATRAPAVLRPAGVAVLLSALLTVMLIVRNTNDGPAWRVGLVLGTVVVVFIALVFGLVVRRVLRKGSARATAWTALVLGVLAVASLAAFWLALPPVFAVAAEAIPRRPRSAAVPRRGHRGDRRRPGHAGNGGSLRARRRQLNTIAMEGPASSAGPSISLGPFAGRPQRLHENLRASQAAECCAARLSRHGV